MKFFMISVGLFVLVSVSTACSVPMCESLVEHPELADKVDLTDEQRAEMEGLFVETEQRIISSEAEIKAKQLEIDRLIRSDNPDMRRIRKLVNESGDARSAVRLARIERDVRTRQVLKPEQALKARKAMRAGVREMRARRRTAGRPEAHMRHRDESGPRMRNPGRADPHMRHGMGKHEARLGRGSCGEGRDRNLRRPDGGAKNCDRGAHKGKHDMPGCPRQIRQSF